MPAPRNPNTVAATAAVRRRGQETMAAKLRAAGWIVMPPEDAEFCGARREHGVHRWSDYGVPKMCGGLSGEDLRELEGAPDENGPIAIPTSPGFSVHFGDDDRTACGKSSKPGMVYQYTQDRRAVTCAACKEAYDRDPCAGGQTVKPSEICPRTGEPGHLHAWQAGRCVS